MPYNFMTGPQSLNRNVKGASQALILYGWVHLVYKRLATTVYSNLQESVGKVDNIAIAFRSFDPVPVKEFSTSEYMVDRWLGDYVGSA